MIESFICNGAEVAADTAKCGSGGGQIAFKSSEPTTFCSFTTSPLGVRGDKGVTRQILELPLQILCQCYQFEFTQEQQ